MLILMFVKIWKTFLEVVKILLSKTCLTLIGKFWIQKELQNLIKYLNVWIKIYEMGADALPICKQIVKI